MSSSFVRLGAAALMGLALLGPLVPRAQAQRVLLSQSLAQQNLARPPGFIPANRYYINPYMTLGQYAYNTSVLGQAYSQVPPYALGYNPYPQVINYGPLYRMYYPVYSNPYASLGYSNPYAGLNYSYLYSGYNFNPLLYSSYYPSYYSSYYSGY